MLCSVLNLYSLVNGKRSVTSWALRTNILSDNAIFAIALYQVLVKRIHSLRKQCWYITIVQEWLLSIFLTMVTPQTMEILVKLPLMTHCTVPSSGQWRPPVAANNLVSRDNRICFLDLFEHIYFRSCCPKGSIQMQKYISHLSGEKTIREWVTKHIVSG